MLIVLMAMCRPSDNANKAVLRRSQTTFNIDGILTICLFGIKNDRNHDSFEISLHVADNNIIDPVSCLMTYMQRTIELTDPLSMAQFSLLPSYKQVDSSTLSQILSMALRLARLPASSQRAVSDQLV